MTDEGSNKGGIICCVLLLAIIGILVFIGSQLSSVYFDNGYEDSFDIFVDGKKEGSVAPDSMEKISIKKGEHTIEIRKRDGELFESNDVTVTEFEYIYNIGRKYLYYIEICEYKVGGGTRWGGWATKNIGSETLIKYPKADYGFDEDCPGSIVVSAGNAYEERTNLKKKINPEAAELSGTADIVENEKESHQVTSVENSLVSYWNFDKDSGDVASDLSGNGGDGTIHGAKLVNGKYGKALSFDGVDDYIEVLTLEDIHTSDWTEEAWIKTTDLSAGVIMCKRHKGSQESLTLHIGCWAGNNKKNNGLSYFSDDEANYEVGAVGTTNVADGKWHHLVGVRKGSNFYIYVDGNLESHNNINIGEFALNDIRSADNWHIGHSGAWNVYFNGTIDEVRIYNYALTEDEIKTAMHSSAAAS